MMDVLVMHLLLHLQTHFFLRTRGNAVDELPVEFADYALFGTLAPGGQPEPQVVGRCLTRQ